MLLTAAVLPGWTVAEMFSRGWPFIVIASGFGTLVANIVRAPLRGRLDILGPMLVVTVGVLFAMDTFLGIGIHQTWPILLIVLAVGVVFKKLFMLPFLPFLRRRL
jgi:hypothetical protein